MKIIQRTLAATAVAVAMAATAGTAFAAGNPSDTAQQRAVEAAGHHGQAPKGALTAPRAAAAGQVETPVFYLSAVNKKSGELNLYFPNGKGGFADRFSTGADFRGFRATAPLDRDKDGAPDASWFLDKSGLLSYSWAINEDDSDVKQIGRGWQIYSKFLSPGNLGGAAPADILGVDGSGVMWVYLNYGDGTLTSRYKVGGGWGQYTEIAGQGDLTGDGKTDIVARDRAGTLWLYKGTGNYKAPFEARTKIGGGWNAYDRILSIGDLDQDGRSDLVARTPGGDLYRYSGNGNAGDPFNKRVKIGYGFSAYNIL